MLTKYIMMQKLKNYISLIVAIAIFLVISLFFFLTDWGYKFPDLYIGIVTFLVGSFAIFIYMCTR